MPRIHQLSPCLWFDHQAEEAAKLYTSIFDRSKINRVSFYTEAGQEIHGRPPGSVLTVDFELDGHAFTALNGGPQFHFTEAISLQVLVETQEDYDHFWERLGAGGDEHARQCGWLKDRYGVSWQIVPAELATWLGDPDRDKANRTMVAMLTMKRLDLAALRRAHDGDR